MRNNYYIIIRVIRPLYNSEKIKFLKMLHSVAWWPINFNAPNYKEYFKEHLNQIRGAFCRETTCKQYGGEYKLKCASLGLFWKLKIFLIKHKETKNKLTYVGALTLLRLVKVVTEISRDLYLFYSSTKKEPSLFRIGNISTEFETVFMVAYFCHH